MTLKDKILGHQIDEITLKLLNNVKKDFPNKKILIHPLFLLEKETDLTYNVGDFGKYVSSSDYVAIYVKQDLNNELFNLALSHELLHHYQCMNGINIISDVDQFCKVKLNNICQIIAYINTSMMDIEVYYKQKLLGYDLTPFLKILINSHIEDISNLEVDINSQNNVSIYFMAFYKCWFINEYLYELDDLTFKNEIVNFYINILSDTNWTLWKSLLSLTKKNPPDNSQNYNFILKEICRRLLKCTAYLKKIIPSHKTINLRLSKLIPYERVEPNKLKKKLAQAAHKHTTHSPNNLVL